MLEIILNILSVLGIILLAIIFLLLAAILLVLFFPVTYRLNGRKTAEKMELSARMDWLFGLVRVRYSYPDPGMLTAKLLWFKLYQTKLPRDAKDKEDKEISEEQGQKASGQEQTRSEKASGQEEIRSEKASEQEEAQSEKASGQEETQSEKASGQGEAQSEEASEQGEAQSEKASEQEKTGSEEPSGGFFKKFHKIKYTICSIYDKIREIWKNISYYTALLQEEDTRQLWAYVKLHTAKILKNIRPRHIRADILFGTGSPDTTGYIFGMYCMLSHFLGARVLVTPDFERAVLEGRFTISGHMTVFVLVVNIVRLMLDKKIRLFIKKLKKEDVGQDGAMGNKTSNGRTSGKKTSHHKKAS